MTYTGKRKYRYNPGTPIADFLWKLAKGDLGIPTLIGDRDTDLNYLWDDAVVITGKPQPIFLAVPDNLPDGLVISEPYIMYYPMASAPRGGTNWALKRSRILFKIAGPADRTYPVADWMIDVLNRFDDSAKFVNTYAGSSSKPDIVFKSIRAEQQNIDEDNLPNFAFDGLGSVTDFSSLYVTVICDYVVNEDYLKSGMTSAQKDTEDARVSGINDDDRQNIEADVLEYRYINERKSVL
jgi:hypothetical protein